MFHRYTIKDEIIHIGDDKLLCGALNAYLSLPSFPCSLYFERDSNLLYEVARYIKNNNNRHYQPIYDCTVCDLANCLKKKLVSKNFIDSCQIIDLASFHQSSIYFTYMFVVSLNPFMAKKLDTWEKAVDFFLSLRQCDGFHEYMCWIEVFKSSNKESLNSIRLKYFRPNLISFISLLPYNENRGNLMESLLNHIASYWVPRLHTYCKKDIPSEIELRPITREHIKNCTLEEIRKLLINVLSYESLSGHVFQNFLLINKMFQQFKYLTFIKGCFAFYDGFSSETVDCLWANRSAWKIISSYLMPSSQNYVYFPSHLVDEVRNSSNPPYDDLFDGVLEYALFNLIPSFKSYMLSYLDIFESIEYEPIPDPVIEIVSDAPLEEVKEKQVESDSINESKVSTNDTDDNANDSKNSQPQKAETENLLASILRNRSEFERFKSFLNSLVPQSDRAEIDANPMMDLNCYIEIEKFKMTKGKQGTRDELATNIKQTYLTKKYFFGPPSPASRNVQIEILGGSGSKMPPRPPSPVIVKIQKHALQRLNNKWVKQYRSTEDYQRRQDQAGSSLSRRKGNENTQSFVFVDSKARANAHEMLQLRRTLLDPVKGAPFKRYAKAKNERFLRDIEFWIEVQKYKDMQHRHSSSSLIRKKIDTIIECFLDSTVLPKVQVSVNNDIAHKIAESRYEMGPYIFRKAQTIVTKVLITLWGEFNTWYVKYNGQLPIAFEKLELDADQKKLVKQMLRQKQKEEEKEKAVLETNRRLVIENASGCQLNALEIGI